MGILITMNSDVTGKNKTIHGHHIVLREHFGSVIHIERENNTKGISRNNPDRTTKQLGNMLSKVNYIDH